MDRDLVDRLLASKGRLAERVGCVRDVRKNAEEGGWTYRDTADE